MNPREYIVRSWKPWESEQGLVRDLHGNFKGSVTFDEDYSEPIDATFKNQPSVGDVKFGIVAPYTTKAGKPRRGFKSASRPNMGQTTAQDQKPSYGAAESPEKQDSIYRSVSLNNAATVFRGQGGPVESVLEMADEFLAWLKQEKKDTVVETDEGDIDLSSIPF